MRLAEIARLEPVQHDVRTGLGRIAVQHDLVHARGAGRIAPLVLVRQGVHDRLRIEAGEFAMGGLDLRAGARSIAENQERSVLVFGPIPMHLLAEMGHECAARQCHAVVRIKRAAASHPPGAIEHHDEAVVRVKVRPAEMISLQPPVAHDIEPVLRRVADQHRILRAGRAWRVPFNLIGFLIDQCRRVELDRIGCARERQCKYRHRNRQAQSMSEHVVLPTIVR